MTYGYLLGFEQSIISLEQTVFCETGSSDLLLFLKNGDLLCGWLYSCACESIFSCENVVFFLCAC